MSAASPGRGSASAWVLAIRPATLPVGAVPVLVGAAVAWAATGGAGFRALPVLLALACALLLQVGTNLANDVFDADKGADTAQRLGPTRATQSGLLGARQVRRAMIGVFALAAALGGALAAQVGWPIVAIGLASILAGVLYTGGPWPLGYHGLGDVCVMVFFGFVAVAGTSFVAAGTVPALAWGAAFPVGALATAVLVVNNVRDRATDAIAGKRTLAVRFGRRFGVAEYAVLVALALATPAALVAAGLARPTALVSLLVLPWALVLIRGVARTDGRGMTPLLGSTARLLLVHGVLLSLGVIT
jgi:1,4-dihydroxy-2-naphthoate octaprenyltransferase